MDGAPSIAQRLGVEAGYRPADEGQVEMARFLPLTTDACLHYSTECKYSKKVKFLKKS